MADGRLRRYMIQEDINMLEIIVSAIHASAAFWPCKMSSAQYIYSLLNISEVLIPVFCLFTINLKDLYTHTNNGHRLIFCCLGTWHRMYMKRA